MHDQEDKEELAINTKCPTISVCWVMASLTSKYTITTISNSDFHKASDTYSACPSHARTRWRRSPWAWCPSSTSPSECSLLFRTAQTRALAYFRWKREHLKVYRIHWRSPHSTHWYHEKCLKQVPGVKVDSRNKECLEGIAGSFQNRIGIPERNLLLQFVGNLAELNIGAFRSIKAQGTAKKTIMGLRTCSDRSFLRRSLRCSLVSTTVTGGVSTWLFSVSAI